MPDLIMHHYFGRNVFKNMPDVVRNEITNLDLYDFATAGADPFFFVKFLNFEKNAQSREFGGRMHREKTGLFLQALIENTKEEKELFSYLCGFITHYVLDSTMHPYIFYATGVYNVNNANTKEYRGLHTKLERAIDIYILKNYYTEKPYRFKIHRHILRLRKLPISLKEVVDKAYTIYDCDNGYEKVNEAIKYQRKFYRFIYDPIGLKHRFLTLLDNGKSSLDFRVLSYYGKEIKDIDILNSQGKKWCNPLDKSIVSNESLFALENKALEKALDLIEKAFRYIFLDEAIDLTKHFLDISYLTGLDCDLGTNMQYFNNIFKKDEKKI